MCEARFIQGSHLLKKISEAVRELVTDANLNCSKSGISMQAMDPRRVSLCALMLGVDGFDHYRCDRSLSLGMSMITISKVMECAGNDDAVTLKADDRTDSLTIMFKSPAQDRICNFVLKSVDMDTEHLGIPKTDYNCTITMPSAEFARIIKDLSFFGDTCNIECSEEGVEFSVAGSLGVGKIMVKQNASVPKKNKVTVSVKEPVTLQFALRYLMLFTKATPLGPVVKISMTPDNPVVLEYPVEETFGYLRYYLAPMVDDQEE